MRLSYKLSLGVGAALAVALGIDAYIEVQRAVAEYEADLLSHTAQQAHALGISMSKLLTSYGDGGATEVLDAANSNESFFNCSINISDEYLDFFTTGKIRKPQFSTAFPAKLLVTQ